MLQQVRDYMLEHSMLTQGELVLVAVSGGPDSVAMLHLLHRLAPEFGADLHVFHLDHGLRGTASTADARYVQALSDRLGLPCTVLSLPEGQLKGIPGSLQANARSIRYRELEFLANRTDARRAAIGHNRDDQAETVLMRFLRGSGRHGLAGIPPVRRKGDLTYIRPLLGVSRGDIEAYCREYGLDPREDASNARTDYLRNEIRLQLLPRLAEVYNPALVENLANMAAIVRHEDELLESMAEAALTQTKVSCEGIALRTDGLMNLHPAIRRRVIRLAARLVSGEDSDLGFEAVERVMGAASRVEGTRTLHLPGGLHVLLEYDVCRFMAAPDKVGDFKTQDRPVALQGVTDAPELGLRLVVCLEPNSPQKPRTEPRDPWEAVFDADRLPGPLRVRTRRAGDRIWPLGMEGSKKLQDILVDSKLPRLQRDRVAVLTAGDEVIWIIGHRVDRRFLAQKDTPNRLVCRADPLNADA